MRKAILVIDENDNVGVALINLKKNEKYAINEEKVILTLGDIKYGHKIALCDIKKGNKIIKYNEILGDALEDIKEGDWVHTHNLGN